MSDWKKILLPPTASVRRAIETIDSGALQIALVVDPKDRLLGTVSDGDVRRAILRGQSLDVEVTAIMNPHPTVARPGDDRDLVLATMKSKQLHRIPVIDTNDTVIGLETLDELIKPDLQDNVVVLMAGGLGTRLQPLTNERPKPMIKIGDRPILETILLNFIEHGFHRFYITVNYKAEMVRDHFGDGSKWGVRIAYIEEKERMGTAGALCLLPEPMDKPLIVMNGDLLTKVNFNLLLDFHRTHKAKATMCVREYDFQVPYGVVRLEDHRLISIEEKPIQRFFVNAGIYVLSHEALEFIPRGYFDMPSLFEALMRRDHETAVFPIREYWLDIGHHADLERANGEFKMVFQ